LYTLPGYMMAIDYVTYQPDDILQKVEKDAMNVSLEGREHFLYHRMSEWPAKLKNDFKYRNVICGKSYTIIFQRK
jgi:asparagine synthase (glutamine-hydrolysing)